MRVLARRKLAAGESRSADVRMVYSPSTRSNSRASILRRRLSSSGSDSKPRCHRRHSRFSRRSARASAIFAVLHHITIIPTIKAILDSPELQIDGFLGRACEHGDRHAAVSLYRRALQAAFGDRWVRAARCAAIGLDALKADREGRCEIENQYNRSFPRTPTGKRLPP